MFRMNESCNGACGEREFFIANLLVRIHYIIVMIKWTGLAPWEFEFPCPGSLTSSFLARVDKSAGPDLSWGSSTSCLQMRSGTDRCSSQFENNYFTEMCSGSEAGSCLRLIDFCITQLSA